MASPRSLVRARPALTVFLAGLLGLFLELALIRWLSSEVRVFSFCKNLVLVACFLGFGAGCFTWRRPLELPRALVTLVLLALLVLLPWPLVTEFGPRAVTLVLSELPGLMIWRQAGAHMHGVGLLQLAFAVSWTAALFFASALVMVPFGQLTAAGMARVDPPLRGYSWSVAGSLAGILAFTAASASWLPPLLWFVPATLATLPFLTRARERTVSLALVAGLCLVLIPTDTSEAPEIWSAYQKLEVQGSAIRVNNIGYQTMMPMVPWTADTPPPVDRFNLPYRLRPAPGRVLIVGAGSGNDAAAALLAGARSVTAVEIDRAIYELGHDRHPQEPYRDPRVRVVIDDARHFLRTTPETFDVVVFSHLDSHMQLSSYTNVRLDDYIYTVESFRQAAARLAPGGLLYVSFFVQQPFVAERIERNLQAALGHPPVTLVSDVSEAGGRLRFENLYYLTGGPDVVAQAEEAWPRFGPRYTRARYHASTVDVSTDAWPFLTLEKPSIPPIMALISAVILAVSAGFVTWARPQGSAFDRRLFWLGAAFMLVEVHNVARLALVFGTTWQVNAWAIAAILTAILLANLACARLRQRPGGLGRVAPVGLFVSLALSWLLPIDGLLALLGAAGAGLVVVVMTAPIFFAGLVFADAFASSTSPGFAMGWNVLGSVVGGMTENVSYVIGVPGLVPVAAVFYALALYRSRPAAEASAPLAA